MQHTATHIMLQLRNCHTTVSTENATPPKSTKSRNSNSSVHLQIKPQSQVESVPQDTKNSEFFELVDFGDAAFSAESVTSSIHSVLKHALNALFWHVFVYKRALQKSPMISASCGKTWGTLRICSEYCHSTAFAGDAVICGGSG